VNANDRMYILWVHRRDCSNYNVSARGVRMAKDKKYSIDEKIDAIRTAQNSITTSGGFDENGNGQYDLMQGKVRIYMGSKYTLEMLFESMKRTLEENIMPRS